MGMKILGHHDAGASGSVYMDNRGVELNVEVDDNKLRQEGVAHDGYEKAFALLPTKDGGWERVDLSYSGSFTERGGGDSMDTHTKFVDPMSDNNVSLDRLRDQGVAFGLDCTGPNGEKTTVWLQNANDNYKPGQW